MTQRKKKWIGVEVDLEDHGTFVAEAHQQSLRKDRAVTLSEVVRRSLTGEARRLRSKHRRSRAS